MYKRKIVEYFAKQPNTVTIDVPLLIRLLEYCKENSSVLTDETIHKIAANIQTANEAYDTVTMDSYSKIINM